MVEARWATFGNFCAVFVLGSLSGICDERKKKKDTRKCCQSRSPVKSLGNELDGGKSQE